MSSAAGRFKVVLPLLLNYCSLLHTIFVRVSSCANPESFARGGPNSGNVFLFYFFCFDEGREKTRSQIAL